MEIVKRSSVLYPHRKIGSSTTIPRSMTSSLTSGQPIKQKGTGHSSDIQFRELFFGNPVSESHQLIRENWKAQGPQTTTIGQHYTTFCDSNSGPLTWHAMWRIISEEGQAIGPHTSRPTQELNMQNRGNWEH
ncbi:hypothetical protein M9H77_18227 [Catharanthus roseus]|uniref:Uncharacterized protein n=1 Tax=Catharanthus roseus TaxID=4058 RepID=A0ACC0B6U9_CATRO|nr:hypothetical protein M9H77_18227 [Catharanthus roseus]